MNMRLVVIMAGALLLTGCGSKEEELQKQIAQLQSEKTALKQSMEERERFVGEVVQAVNDVYADVEAARVKEAKLVQRVGGPEGTGTITNNDTRKELLSNISEIGATLKENQTKIANLQAKAKTLGGQIAGLNKVIEGLKQTIAEREASIAALEARVSGLESSVAEKTKMISERDLTISEQQKALNTAYYIVGTRSELKDKGIINDEGGFLWGLLGSTTVLGNEIDRSLFTAIDITKDEMIQIDGEVDLLIPKRKEEFFELKRDGNTSALAIKNPTKFWQEKYLVIVLN
jgi:predicted  nucleic acid-binding Zn-ribbon protein